jgi:hypothetical protein
MAILMAKKRKAKAKGFGKFNHSAAAKKAWKNVRAARKMWAKGVRAHAK